MKKQVPCNPIDEARVALEELPPKAPGKGHFSKFAAIEALFEPLVQARRLKNYTDSELVELLEEKGIGVSLGTFRQYMQRVARKRGERPTRKQAKADANTSANEIPKVSETATKPPANAGTKRALSGHKLNDDDV